MSPAKTPEETRARIVQAAYETFHRNGYQGSSINQILELAGITKGALFHHFKNKQELGYAVVDEILQEVCNQNWIQPLSETNDPVETLKEIIIMCSNEMEADPEVIQNGCPINNLCQEMSPLDEGFRLRLEQVMSNWRQALAQAFSRGIECGNVHPHLVPESIAAFIVACLEGMIGQIKTSQDLTVAQQSAEGFFGYLDTLKPTE